MGTNTESAATTPKCGEVKAEMLQHAEAKVEPRMRIRIVINRPRSPTKPEAAEAGSQIGDLFQAPVGAGAEQEDNAAQGSLTTDDSAVDWQAEQQDDAVDVQPEDLQDAGDDISEAANQEPSGATKCARCNYSFTKGDPGVMKYGRPYHRFQCAKYAEPIGRRQGGGR